MNTSKRRLAGIILFILFLACAISACLITVLEAKVYTYALQGSGTQSDPYVISSVDDLKAFRDGVNGGNAYAGKYVQLTADLDLQCKIFEPIGNTSAKSFKGIFDGNGNTIKNLFIKKGVSAESAAGLFGYISNNAQVKNLTLDNVNIYFYSSAGTAATSSKAAGTVATIYGGGAVGYGSASTISGITVIGGLDIVAGNAGNGYASNTAAYNKGGTGGSAYAGGIVGCLSDNSKITDCSFTGNVYGYGGYGGNGGAPSAATGGVGGQGGNVYVGGIAAAALKNTQILRSCANAELLVRAGNGGNGGNGANNTSYKGGAAGAGGAVRGGGIVGAMRGTLLSDCFATGNMNLWNPVNGVPGSNFTLTGTNANTAGNATRNSLAAGGIAAIINPETHATTTTWIQNVYSKVNVTEYYDNYFATDTNTRIGGIVGSINTPNVKLKNTVTLGATYTAEGGTKKADGTTLRGTAGATMSPVATYDVVDSTVTVAGVRSSVESLAEDVYYEQSTRYNETASPKEKFSLGNAQLKDFDGTFNFNQTVWTGTSGLPVLKGVPYNARPSYTFGVNTAADLIAVAKKINSGLVRYDTTINLNADIDLGGDEWIGLGADFSHCPYKLVINGNGHKISNLYSTKTTDNKGLVPYARILQVKNLTVEDPVISGKGGNNAGALAGFVQYYGIFENCHAALSDKITAQSSVIRGKTSVGGLVGGAQSFAHKTRFLNCSNGVNVNCFATAADTYFSTGGLIGLCCGGTVKNCYVTGNVMADAYSGGITCYLGALIGQASRQAIIENCFATGNIQCGSEASFIGCVNTLARGTTLKNCVFTGEVKYTFSPVSSSYIRYGGLIARCNSLETQFVNNVVLTPKVTFHANINNTANRRFGTLLCSTGIAKTLTGKTTAKDANGSYPAIKNTAVYTNNYTIATNWSATHNNTALDNYFINDTNKTTVVDAARIHTKDYWENVIGFDFDDTWEWNDGLEGGLPTLKDNKFSAPGLGDHAITIADKNDLNAFRNLVNAGTSFEKKTVKLIADIDLGGAAWTPIGKDTTTAFKGTFEGGGHTIYNLNVNKASANKGLFVYLRDGAVVKNLTLVNPVIVSNGYENTGAVAGGMENASILNCHVIGGSITSTANYVGGIVGLMKGTQPAKVAKCSVTSLDPTRGYLSPISGKSTGGIVGGAIMTATLKGLIEDCYCTRPVNCLDNAYGVGGIAGVAHGTTVRRCYSTNSVTASRGSNVGGIVGTVNNYKSEIYDCFSTGTIYSVSLYATDASTSAYSCAGGILGRNNMNGTKIERCYALGEIMTCVQVTNTSNTSRATSGGILGCSNQKDTTVQMGANISLSPVISSGNVLNDHNQVTSKFAITDANTTATINKLAESYYLDGAFMSPSAVRKTTNCLRWDNLGSAKPLSAFKEESLYAGINWDMDNVWEMQEGVNDGLPYLKSLGAPIFEVGSAYNPIQINNKGEFQSLVTNVNNAICYDGQYVELNCDLDLSGVGRMGYEYKRSFSGHFDGKGHVMKNCSVTSSTTNVGVFAYVTNATIKNLTVDKPTVRQTGTSSNCAGGLIGYSLCNLTLENCAVTGGTVTAQGQQTGGLVGFANHGYNRITRCFATAKVTGGARVGGLVGLFRNGKVERCYSVADVTGNLTNNYAAGGLIGRLDYGGTVQDCYAKGIINDSSTASGAVSGGIVGEISAPSATYAINLNRCYFSGTLTGRTTAAASGTRGAYIGGVVGLSVVKISVTNCAVLATSMSATATQASNARTGYITNSTAANAPIMTNNLRLDPITVTTAKGSSYASQNTSVAAPKDDFISEDPAVNKFRTTLAWDFDNVWTQSAGANDGLPMLMGLPTDVTDVESLLAAAKGYKAEDWNVPTFTVLTNAIAEVETNFTSINTDNKDYYVKLLSDAIAGLRPETSSLQSLYDDIKTNKEPYKEWYTNFAAMDNALTQAKTILDEDSNKYKNKDVVTALANLMMADANLQVDKTRLNEAIKKCSGVIESDYQPAEWATLQAELKNGVKVFGNADATAFEVKTATEALEAAIAGLKADKQNLEKKIAAAYSALGGEVSFTDGVMTVVTQPTLTAEKFVKFDTFETALQVAEQVYANANALTSEVISSAYNLGVALNNLVLDRTELRDEYNIASLKKESQFTPESWAAFKTAYDNAGVVLQKPEAAPADFVSFSAEIDEALAALRLAADGLAVDKAQLEALIAIARVERDRGDIYEGDTLDKLVEALEEAEDVVANSTSGSVISAAAVKLNDAILNLKINLDFLKTKLREAESYLAVKDKEYYTQGSMNALQTAYGAAKAFEDAEEGSLTADDLTAVKDATKDLTDALDGMQANVERLRTLIASAEAFDDDAFDESSVNDLKTLAATNKLMLEGEYTDEQVIKGIKDLDYAFDNLRADKSALIELVEEVSSWVNVKYRQDENGDWIVDENGNLKTFVVYSTDSWNALQAVLASAEDIVNKPDATVAEVEEAYQNLQQAIDDLEIDLSELLDRITQANNLLNGTTVYTAATTSALTTARDDAQDVADTVASLTLQDVQTALDNLVAAINGLEVDLTELNRLIGICDQQEARKDCFTSVTYSNMAAQAAFVKGILEAGNQITVQEYNDYVSLLTLVLNQLEVDTSALVSAIGTAEALESQFITSATYAAVQSAVQNAQALLDSGDLTASDYEDKLASVTDYVTYLNALNQALANIQPDLNAFRAFINEKNQLTSLAYTEDSLNGLKSAIKSANDALASSETVWTYDLVIVYVEAIRAAVNDLVPDTTNLVEKVQQIVAEMNTEHTAPIPDENGELVIDPLYMGKDAFTYEYYTADSYKALTDVIDEVNDLVQNIAGTTIGEVEALYNRLIAAYNGLVIDKSALKELLDECSSLDGEFYSEDSFNALQTAIADGESVYENDSVTLAAYVAAYNQLAAAKDGLCYDTTSLSDLIARARAIIAATEQEEEEGKLYYTKDSLDALKEALEEAELFDSDAASDPDAASEALNELTDLCDALSGAIENLVDLSALRNKIAEAEGYDNDEGTYPASAFAALSAGIDEAKEVYATDEATAEQVSEQIEKLDKLIAALTARDHKFIIKSENTIYALVDGKNTVLDQNEREYDDENPTYLVNVALNDSVADIISQFTNTDIKAYLADGVTEITDRTNTKIATGILLRLYAGEEILDEITVVLKCDLNGDGKVNAVDKAQINAYFLGTKTLEGAFILACDMNGDGKLNAIDKAQINAYFLGNKNIYEGLSVKE